MQVLEFPVATLIHFWVNHHLLDLFQRPCWRVVSGRGKQYVDRILEGGCRLPAAWLAGGRCLLLAAAVCSALKPLPVCRPGNALICLPACPAELPDVRTSTPVESVRSLGEQGPVRVTATGGASEEFDAVLLATHSDVSLKMLGEEGPQVRCQGLERRLPCV